MVLLEFVYLPFNAQPTSKLPIPQNVVGNAEECDHLIDGARPRLQRSGVVDDKAASGGAYPPANLFKRRPAPQAPPASLDHMSLTGHGRIKFTRYDYGI